MTTIVACTRPLPGPFDLPELPGVEIRVGPRRGFGSVGERDGFIGGAHGVVAWVTERVDGGFLAAAGPQLKIVANFAVGYDNIDLAACAERGVTVTNTPDAVTTGTADVAFGLLIAAARRFAEADTHARSARWADTGVLAPDEMIGVPIAGRTLHIVGAGRIGYATALRSVGWGMPVLYTARSRKPAFEHPPLNAQRVSLDEGLRRADFVSVHTPLTPGTRHLIGAEQLALMKPTAVLINTSRGAVIDEAALAAALTDRTLFAAGLDVFENEPAVHPDIRSCPFAVLTPHFGSADAACRAEMTRLCRDNIAAVLSGEPPLTPVCSLAR